MMKTRDHRYRSEQQLRRWLRYRNWRWWGVWRVVGWGIFIGTILVTVGMCYAYR